MDKTSLSERDICTKFIAAALRRAGWDEITQIREEISFTKGRIIVRGKLVTRGKAKRVAIHARIKPLLIEENWQGARNLASELRDRLVSDGFQPDGLRVQAGQSWLERFTPAEML